jgi:hypothetical protein
VRSEESVRRWRSGEGGETYDTSTKAEDESRSEKTKTTTEELSKRVSEDGTEEASSLVSRDDVCSGERGSVKKRRTGKRGKQRTGRDGGKLLRGLGRQAELALEGREGDGGTDEGRVVSIEEKQGQLQSTQSKREEGKGRTRS